MQSSDHLADQDDPTLEGSDRAMVSWVEGGCDPKVRDGLLRRAARVDQELAKLCHGAPPAGLGYIRAHGEGGAHELIAALGLARSAERAGDARGVCGERAGQFMDAQPSRMSFDHHGRE